MLDPLSAKVSVPPQVARAEQPLRQQQPQAPADLPADLVDQLALAGSEEPAPPSPPPTPREQRMSDAAARLREQGRTFLPGQEAAILTSFDQGKEALVRVESGHSVGVPFRSLEDVELYADLLSGTAPQDSKTAQSYQALQGLEDKGSQFFFGRDGAPVFGFLPINSHDTWFRTDAGGAALALKNGEQVRVITGNGELTELSKPTQAGELAARTPEPPAERVELSKLMDRLNTAGLYFMPNQSYPDDLLVTEYGEKYKRDLATQVKSAFGESLPTSPVLQQKKMMDDLAAGERVQVYVDGEYPIYPLLVNKDELRDLAQMRSQPTPEMQQVQKAFTRLTQGKCPVFTRGGDGDYEGATLRATNPEALWLALEDNREVSFLTPTGDLVATSSREEFLDAVYANLGSPENREFAAALRGVEKAGTRFWYPVQGKQVYVDGFDVGALLGKNQAVYRDGPDGAPVPVGAKELAALAQASPAQPPAALDRVDPAQPKTNLFMVYHQPLHDPTGLFTYYDDAVTKLKEAGSNSEVDMVVQHSDLFNKRTHRRDYVQKGALEPLKTLDSRQALSDPQVFENFVYDTVKEFPDRDKVRLMVFGHGGGERGLLDDLVTPPNGQPFVDGMTPEEFADSIHKALDRVEEETGKRPVIDNLVVASCLMGNTSFIDALARRGDVKVVSASPENLMDELLHRPMLEFMQDPATSNADARQFGEKLVDISMAATGFTNSPENRRHALIYGSYDLDPKKNERFRDALGGFFQACLEHPGSAAYVRQDIQDCPGYNIHPAGGPGIGEDQRDLLQVAETVAGDRRVSSGIREAAKKLVEAHSDQVISQKTERGYEGRRGASLLLPLQPERWSFNDQAPTELLRDTPYTDFLKLVMSAPDRRAAHDLAAERLYRKQGQAQVEAISSLEPLQSGKLAQTEQETLSSKAERLPENQPGLGARVLGTAQRVVAAVAGGLVGGALGVGLGALAGGAAGARGHSMTSGGKASQQRVDAAFAPAEPHTVPMQQGQPQPKPEGPKTVWQAMERNSSLSNPLVFAPLEYVGTEVHHKLAYSTGFGFLASLVATPLGAVSGALAGLFEGIALGATAGWQAPKSS